jgi:hypothetical protein
MSIEHAFAATLLTMILTGCTTARPTVLPGGGQGHGPAFDVCSLSNPRSEACNYIPEADLWNRCVSPVQNACR